MRPPGSRVGRYTSRMQPSLVPNVRIKLVPVPVEHLAALARGEVPADIAPCGFSDGLPPPHVAQRMQRYIEAGKPATWVSGYYVLDAGGCCVGGCGFKDVPRAREVEIGYAIATAQRGRGFASAAVAELLQLAAASLEVDTVIALIAEDNLASQSVARRNGFVAGERVLDEDGEWVLCFRHVLCAGARSARW